MLKERKKALEDKKKLDKLRKEKKFALSGIKGEFTFNYEGGLVGVKRIDMTKASSLQQSIP